MQLNPEETFLTLNVNLYTKEENFPLGKKRYVQKCDLRLTQYFPSVSKGQKLTMEWSNQI